MAAALQVIPALAVLVQDDKEQLVHLQVLQDFLEQPAQVAVVVAVGQVIEAI